MKKKLKNEVIIKQLKCESIKQTSHGVSDEKYRRVFILKYCMSRRKNLSGNVGGLGTRSSPTPPMKHINVEMELVAACVIYDTIMVCIPSLSCVVASRFKFSFTVWACRHCLQLRYSVSHTKLKHWKIITYRGNCMKVKFQFALNNEICSNTQFENTLTNYTKSDIPTHRICVVTYR